MSIHTDVAAQIKEALKAKDAVRLTVVRGLVAAFVNELVAKRRKPDGELTDDEALAVIRRSVKQRKDSIEQFSKGGRQDLVDAETAELKILEAYLPAQMGRDEIRKIVDAKKKELGISDLPAQAGKKELGISDLPAQAGKKDSGKLMSAVMKELNGKADGQVVKEVVEAELS